MRNGLRIAAIVAALPLAALAQRGGRMGRPMPGAAPPFPPQPPAANGPVVQIRAATRVVDIEVSAEGGNGQPVANLKQSDFTVFDDGHPRPFTIFSFNPGAKTSPAPSARPALPPGEFSNLGAAPRIQERHSVVLLVDAFNGWFENFVNARQAVIGALAKIPPDERIALYVISRYDGLQLLQDYTTDHARLREAITKYIPNGTCPADQGTEATGASTQFTADLGPPPPPPEGPPDAKARAFAAAAETSFCKGSGRPGTNNMINGVDSARLALEALATSLQSLPGRKSVFWITEGFPPTMLENTATYAGKKVWSKTFAMLNDANVAVDTLDSNGVDGPARLWGAGGVLSMQDVAATTGGTAYYNNGDLAAALATGITATRSSYTLGFYLKQLDRKYHTLKVVVDRPGVHLTYRHGYYAEDDAQRAKDQKKSDLRTAMMNPVGETGVGITALVKPDGKKLDLTLNLDPSTLTISSGDGGWLGQVDELFVERNADGRQVSQETDTKRFEMSASNRIEVDHDGLNLRRSLQLAPGATQLEVVVRDHASGRVGSLNIPIPAATAAAIPAGN